LRQTDQSEETLKARKSFFDSHGWLANNNRMGSRTVLEFKLGPKFLKPDEVRLAVVYASDAKSPQYWPEGLADDCIKEDLIFGKTPQDMKFNQSKLGQGQVLIRCTPAPTNSKWMCRSQDCETQPWAEISERFQR